MERRNSTVAAIMAGIAACAAHAQSTIEKIAYPTTFYTATLRLNDRGDVGGLVTEYDCRAFFARLAGGEPQRVPLAMNANLQLVGVDARGAVTVAASGGDLPPDITRFLQFSPAAGTVSQFDLPVVYNPRGFSDTGQFVATVLVNGRPRCARYTPGVGLELLPAIGFQSMSRGINARGDVSALVDYSASASASARFRDGEGWRIVVVPSLGSNQPTCMSERGDIAGYTYSSTGALGLPFLSLDSGPTSTLQPEQGAQPGFALAINRDRWVLGQLNYSDYFLWTPKHGMRPLTGLLPVGSDLWIRDAQDINDSGEIVGVGVPEGSWSAVIYVLRLNGQTIPALSASQPFRP